MTARIAATGFGENAFLMFFFAAFATAAAVVFALYARRYQVRDQPTGVRRGSALRHAVVGVPSQAASATAVRPGGAQSWRVMWPSNDPAPEDVPLAKSMAPR